MKYDHGWVVDDAPTRLNQRQANHRVFAPVITSTPPLHVIRRSSPNDQVVCRVIIDIALCTGPESISVRTTAYPGFVKRAARPLPPSAARWGDTGSGDRADSLLREELDSLGQPIRSRN